MEHIVRGRRRRRRSTIRPMPRQLHTSLVLVMFGCSIPLFVVLFPMSTHAQIGTCDAVNDPCPFANDGECDADTVAECAGGDCFDCDICRNFDYDCAGCINSGCYWCPGDATCIGNLYSFARIASCVAESDYVTDTCVNSNNFFRYEQNSHVCVYVCARDRTNGSAKDFANCYCH